MAISSPVGGYKRNEPRPNRFVLVDDDFETGMQGWHGLIDSGDNYYPTLHNGSLSGSHALCIDTRGGVANVTASATKRLPAFPGKWHCDFMVAWNAKADAGGPEQNGLDKIRFSLDWQSGASTRKWMELRYIHYVEGTGIAPSWQISDGSANTYNAVTEIGAYELGFNQAYKYDYHRIGYSFNVGEGNTAQWDKLRVDGREFDISSYNAETPQVSIAEFDNGANMVIECKNRTSNSNADPMVLIDRVRIELEEFN